MQIYNTLGEIPPADGGRSLALGTFDGVHLGHRRVIRAALDWARAQGVTASVVTFDPHPLRVLRPDDPPVLLTTTEVKVERVRELGVDELVVIPFTRELSRMEAEAFCSEVLAGALRARHVSVGENFRFGHNATGNVALLESHPEFETEVVPLVERAGRPVSSSRIRGLVERGLVDEAAELLGAPFTLEGPVVKGAGRGHDLDMPTANLDPPAGIVLPATGIYAARAHVGGRRLAAAVSVGVRPTFERDGDLAVEAHLVDFEGDLYGKRLRLGFLRRLRDELRFDSPEELVDQMRRDVEQTREIVAAVG